MHSFRITKPALATFATLAAVLVASEAGAERPCLQDPAITGRTCPEAECLLLQDDVNLRCKSPAPVSCTRLAGCNVLRREKVKWLDCYAARNRINIRCWGGGDFDHQQKAAEAIGNVAKCEQRIALPEPIGCADPCPQLPLLTAEEPAPEAVVGGPEEGAGGEAKSGGKEEPSERASEAAEPEERE